MRTGIVLLLVVPLAVSGQLFGQERERVSPGDGNVSHARVGMEQALEKDVDPDEYTVGPGDVLAIGLFGGISADHTLSVTPEGKVLIPTVGDLYVSGLLLSKAKEVIKAAILDHYRNVEVSVNLAGLRRFRVIVSGAVQRPGVYEAQGVDRVSEVIGWAGELVGLKEGKKIGEEEFIPYLQYQLGAVVGQASRREILIRHGDGTSTRVDVFRFAILGETGGNPYVWDGDVIHVPLVRSTVMIYGAVTVPGEYEIVDGDRLSDLLEMARGLTPDAWLDQAEVVRFNPDHVTTRTFTVDLRRLGEGDPLHDPLLERDDRVFIRSVTGWHLKRNVTIDGEVRYPGEYSIREGQTRLRDVIQRAGGFTPDASLEKARIVRMVSEEMQDAEFERLKLIPVADMTETEYEYFKMKSRERRGAMVVDFMRLFEQNDELQNIILKDGDRIVIPAKPRTVNVSGQVANPGAVVYRPGKTVEFYIQEAGGYAWNARRDKTRVIRARTGEWLWSKRVKGLEPGDTIWIPERPERDWWGIFRELMTVAAEAATVYIVIDQAISN